jgi:arylsulfatase A-like enzyme/Tfp pilus assembly protein PilF
MSMWRTAGGILFALSVLLTSMDCGKTAGKPGGNLLVITVDTLRADRIGAAGYKIETPHMDRLAASGLYFTQATTSAPITLPSHATVFTSKYPFSHGVRMNGPHVLGGQHQTLAETLKGAGMQTGAVTSAFVLHSMFGLAQGFDDYAEISRSTGGGTLGEFLSPSLTTERRGDATTASALEWLSKARKPWFLWVHYFDPHTPYDAPEPFKTRFPRPYEAEVAYADSQVGLLMQGLAKKGEVENTLVVLMGDHGEALGFQGEGEHGIFLYEPTMRVPLMFSGRGVESRKVVDMRVGLVDVAPTILDLMGMEAPPDFQGRSLRPLWESSRPEERLIYLEAYLPYYNNRWAPFEGVVQGSWKYIFGPQRELFDLQNDLREEHNLAKDDSKRAEAMHAALVNLRRSLPKAEGAAANLSPEDIQRLRSLGYLSGGASGFEEPDALKLASSLPDPHERIGAIAHAGRARQALSEGDASGARVHLDAALAIDPQNLICLRMLAQAQGQMGDAESELATLRLIGKMEPESLWVYYRKMAESYRSRGDDTRRREALSKAVDSIRATELKTGSLLPIDIFILSQLYLDLGDTEKAVQELQNGKTKHPDYVAFAFQMGSIAQESGQLKDAVRHYEEALRMEPGLSDARINLSNTLGMMGQFERANAMLEDLHGHQAPTAQTLYNMGVNYAQMKRYAEAEGKFRQALELDPRNVPALSGMARLSLMARKPAQAREWARRALEVDPSDEFSKTVLAKVPAAPPS